MHCRAFTRPLPRVRDPLRKKREKENSPTSQSFRTSSAVSVCVTPPLPSTLRWMQPTSSLGVLPTSSSGLLPSSPSNYLTHTSDSKNLYTSPSSVPPYAPSWAVCPPLLPAICVFFPSPYFSLSSFRARVTPPPLHSSKVPFALA